MPISPSAPGKVTIFDLVGEGLGLGRDDFKLEGVWHLGLFDLLDPALHVEVAFADLVVFAVQDFLETADRVGHRHLFASRPVKTWATVNGWLRKR